MARSIKDVFLYSSSGPVICYHCLIGKTEETKDETLKSQDNDFHTGQKPRLAEGTNCQN